MSAAADERPTIESALLAVMVTAQALDSVAAAEIDDASPDDLARALWLLTETLGSLRGVADMLDSKLAKRLPWGEIIEVDGVPVPLRRTSKSGGGFTWDHDGAARAVASRVADSVYDRQTGELAPPGEITRRTAEALVRCAGVSYWRIEESLAAYGVDMDEFREKKPSSGSTVEFDPKLPKKKTA